MQLGNPISGIPGVIKEPSELKAFSAYLNAGAMTEPKPKKKAGAIADAEMIFKNPTKRQVQ